MPNRTTAGALVLTAVSALLVSDPTARGAEDEDLLSLTLVGHQAAREAIRTFSADVSVDESFPSRARLARGKYWRSFDTVRIQQGDPRSAVDEYLVNSREIRQVGRNRAAARGVPQYAAMRKPPHEFLSICDVWTEMLIDFAGPTGGQYAYEQFLEFAVRRPTAQRDTLDGRDCVRLTLTLGGSGGGAGSTVTLWHDIGYNYLVRKMRSEQRAYQVIGEAEASEFVEAAPGIFFPQRCERRLFRNGKQTSGRVTRISHLRVNAPMPQTRLGLPAVPPGTILQDAILSKSYPINANWEQIGAARPYHSSVAPGLSESHGGAYTTQSTTEQGSVVRWLLPIAAACLLLGGAGWLWRRARGGSEAAS